MVVREVVEFFIQEGVRHLALEDPTERTVEMFVAGVVAFRENALARAVLEYEPEALAELVGGDWRSLNVVRDVLATGLLGPGIDDMAAQRAAEVTLRLTASFLVAPSHLYPLDTAQQARAFAQAVLVPIVEASRAADA